MAKEIHLEIWNKLCFVSEPFKLDHGRQRVKCDSSCLLLTCLIHTEVTKWSVSNYYWLALEVSINETDIWLYVLLIMILLLAALWCDDPFWCSASSLCLLGWKWGQCRLAKSTVCPLSLLWVSRLCLLFFSTFSSPAAVSSFSLSQSNYWSSCINCQHLPTWPCQWGGNSAPSWFSQWLNALAPSF